MKLSRALRIEPGNVIALVGSGGKTTTMMKLAKETSPVAPVLLTTTTHLAQREAERVTNRLVAAQGDWVGETGNRLRQGAPLLLTGPLDQEQGKMGGLSRKQWANLMARIGGHHPITIVEADGARGRPLKAPLGHEPEIPAGTSLVVLLIGMDGLGQLVGDSSVHRPARFAELAAAGPGATITPELIGRALLHCEGYAAKVPPGARLVVFLNQAEDPSRREAAQDLAQRILQSPAVAEVLIGSAISSDPVQVVKGRTAGVVLAAGSARRMGEPKLLKEFRGRPLVAHAVELASRTTEQVLVILGANQSSIRLALAGRDVRFVENPHWDQGQSTSVRAAVHALGESFHSALFLLGDQPLIPDQLVHRLVARHAQTLSPLVAPRVAGRQANPVLFDQATWPALLQVRGDVGGRGLLDRYPVEWIEWPDPNAFLDLDTAEDYRKLLELE